MKIKCDFCSDTDGPHERVPCHDFQLLGINFEGDWAACPVCRSLLRAEDWAALSQRSIDTHPEYTRLPKDFLRTFVLKLHAEFRKHCLI